MENLRSCNFFFFFFLFFDQRLLLRGAVLLPELVSGFLLAFVPLPDPLLFSWEVLELGIFPSRDSVPLLLCSGAGMAACCSDSGFLTAVE